MIREVNDPAECRALWERLSPGERLWDDWALMWAFHDEAVFALRFLVKEAGGAPTGLVPMVHNRERDRNELFGGSYPDSRTLWIDRADWPAFFEAIDAPAAFFDLRGAWVDALLAEHPGYAGHFTETDQRFYLEPAAFGGDFYNHIRGLGSDTRQGLLYDLRRVQKLEPTLRWSRDDEVGLFIDLVNRRFGAESDYATPAGQAELRRVTAELAERGWLRTLVIEVAGQPEAVSLSAVYGDSWISLYASSNHQVKNLGKLLTVETIQAACREGVREINYMTGMAWKAAWGMSWEPARTFRNPPDPETGKKWGRFPLNSFNWNRPHFLHFLVEVGRKRLISVVFFVTKKRLTGREKRRQIPNSGPNQVRSWSLQEASREQESAAQPHEDRPPPVRGTPRYDGR